MHMRRHIWAGVGLLLTLTGCGGGGLLMAEDHSSPSIAWVDISRVPAASAINISARVTDLGSGLGAVSVIVQDSSGAKATYPMHLQAGNGLYAAELPATASRIQVMAKDRAGNVPLSPETGVPPLPPF
jgi:hypothetical protein